VAARIEDEGRDRPSAPIDRAAVMRSLGVGLRRLKTGGDQVAASFAVAHEVNHTDLAALIHVMDAESGTEALTAGQLQRALGLTSGAVTAVVDRLERDGHVRRDRDLADRRRVRLRLAGAGRAVGESYFGPLGERSREVMDRFSDAELAVIDSFVTAMAEVYERFSAGTAAPAEPRSRPDRPSAISGERHQPPEVM
jgi:DNA-binding MarR family transcriptional regulator